MYYIVEGEVEASNIKVTKRKVRDWIFRWGRRSHKNKDTAAATSLLLILIRHRRFLVRR